MTSTNGHGTLVLFDVDGTLTEARKPITMSMITALCELCRYAEIGFLTGSGLEYIKEQLWPALNNKIIRENCHLLPCNGTEYVVPLGEETLGMQAIFKASMREFLGDKEFNQLMRTLCILQGEIVKEKYDISLTGNFVQNRESMINWCPIGRNAKQSTRDHFKAMDKLYGIRKKYLEILKEELKKSEIDVIVKLGGNTSFDIYPCNWDKTYALNHFDPHEWDFWFVGDRCGVDGNDYEIFNLLKPKGRAFETGSPEETVEIIDFYILEDLQYRR
jgi:phosphomannomutase